MNLPMNNDQTKDSNGFFDEGKNLSEILNEAMDLRSLDAKKLAELTDIPAHYLSALSSGDFSKLPAVPYVRGYLAKIADALRIDVNLLLRAYKQEILLRSVKTSGSDDKLPTNRFTFKTSHRKRNLIIIGIVLALLIAFLIWRLDDFLGTPRVQITNPSFASLIVNQPSITLSGEVNPQDKLTVNGEEVLVEKDGKFSKDFSLQPGINTIAFKVKRFLGKEVEVIRQVIYQP
jgi:hypothetical protein